MPPLTQVAPIFSPFPGPPRRFETPKASTTEIRDNFTFPCIKPPDSAKYCYILDDLNLEVGPSDAQIATSEAGDKEHDWGVSSSGLERLLAQYFELDPEERSPELLGEEASHKIAEYCLEIDLHPAGVLMRAFENWIALLHTIEKEPFLATQCDPRVAASFGQLADQVYRALGFPEEERVVGLLQASREVGQALADMPTLEERGIIRGLGTPIFNDAEDILVGLVSFHCRALDSLGVGYRQHLAAAMQETGGAIFRNYRTEKLQFGNKIELIRQANQLIADDRFPDRLAEFGRKFGVLRHGIIDLEEWQGTLEHIAIVRGTVAHPSTVLVEDDLVEIRESLSHPLEQLHFETSRLDYHLNERGELVVQFDLRQLRILLQHALEWLSAFYTYLEDIYPEVQLHDRVELWRDGSSWLIYTDEDRQTRQMELGRMRNFEDVFFPGKRVFFRHLVDGTKKWMCVQEHQG